MDQRRIEKFDLRARDAPEALLERAAKLQHGGALTMFGPWHKKSSENRSLG